MYKKRKKKKYEKVVIIAVIMIVLFIGSLFVLAKKNKLTFVESWIKDSGLFIEKIVLKPLHLIKEKLTDKELESLKEKASAYDALEVKNKELEHQLNNLKKTLELNTALSDQSYLNTTVVNRNIDYWYQMMTIDKGKKSGIIENLPVVVNEGLVGLTSNVSNFNSSVILLTSEKFPKKISVKIEVGEHYVYGLLSGYNYKNKTFQIEGISENTEIPIGSLVTTSGLGENIPAGISVGYVKNITSDNFDLARIVEAESKVNFEALSYVTVLKRGDLTS